MDYNPYDATHVLAQTQLLFFSALAFVWLNLYKMYPPELKSVNLEVDWLYRRLIPRTLQRLADVKDVCVQKMSRVRARHLPQLTNYLSKYYAPQGILAKTSSTGTAVMWIMLMLLAYLLISLY